MIKEFYKLLHWYILWLSSDQWIIYSLLLFYRQPNEQFRQLNIEWDDDGVRFVLSRHALFPFFCASAATTVPDLTPRSIREHYPKCEPTVFALSPECVISGEATNTKIVVFGLTQTIYRTRGEYADHSTGYAVLLNRRITTNNHPINQSINSCQ